LGWDSTPSPSFSIHLHLPVFSCQLHLLAAKTTRKHLIRKTETLFLAQTNVFLFFFLIFAAVKPKPIKNMDDYPADSSNY